MTSRQHTQRFVGWALISVYISMFLLAFSAASLPTGFVQGISPLLGLFMLVFGIWGGMLLIKASYVKKKV